MATAVAAIFFRVLVYGICWCADRVSSSRCCSGKSHGKAAIMRRQPARASFLRVSASSPLSVRLNLTSLALCHLASSSTARENGRLARRLLQLNSGVEASGAGAESEGDARAVDFPSCPRCVAVRVVVSDACKASHIQRSPLSMGGLWSLESGVLSS